MLTSILAVAALLAGQAAASAFSSTDSLVKRSAEVSVDDVPAACEDTCSNLDKLLSTCSKIDPNTNTSRSDFLDCFCGDNFHRAFTNCLACTASADSVREGSLTSQLRNYESTCNDQGRTVPAFPLSETNTSGGSTPTNAPEKNGSTPGIALFAGTLVGAVGAAIAVLA